MSLIVNQLKFILKKSETLFGSIENKAIFALLLATF